VKTDRTFAVGERLVLVLSTPTRAVEVEGEVVWRRGAEGDRPAGVGIRIPVERSGDRAKLARLLAASKGESS
jgi:Tfp pilus assembly protein PilZ